MTGKKNDTVRRESGNGKIAMEWFIIAVAALVSLWLFGRRLFGGCRSRSGFKFNNPELEAHYQREMEDGLEAYELRHILKEAKIRQIQQNDECSIQEAAKKWQAARECAIHAQSMLLERGVDCSKEDAERIIRRAEQDQARDFMKELEKRSDL